MDGPQKDYLLEPLSERELEILRLIEAGCTNREIAQKLVLSLETIKWYNKQIYSKLGVHNRTQAVASAKADGLLGAPSETCEHPSFTPRHNFPAQVTSFIGRQREITEIMQLLVNNRLLTLSGPPGTGKTRLALQVASQVLHQFKDGVYFIDLAPISDPGLVTTTIAQLLGIGESGSRPLLDALKNYLRRKNLLLLLDNFEQIVGAAPIVGELLSSSPGLKALVTSREVMRIYGEQEYLVPPLTLPDLDPSEPVRSLLQYEAVELFIHRARAVRPDFSLTEDNAKAVAEICVRLDGLPLALELAAARSTMLSPEMMRRRLESRLGVLVSGPRDIPARQQTLRGAIDWSYDLLEPPEKTLFARLAIFQGGRTVEAVETVCSHDLNIDVFTGLESLMNKSLLRRIEGIIEEPRFVMLEMIHEYARERLQASGEAEDLQRRHAEYFLALAERGTPELRGSRYAYWSALLREEHNNLRTALVWALGGGDTELGLQLAGALRDFWSYEGYTAEGLAWTEQALESTMDAPPPLRAKALNTAGAMCYYRADHKKGKRYNQEALAIFRELGDDRGTAWALGFLGVQALTSPVECKEGIKQLEEALALFRKLDYRPGITQVLIGLGEVARLDGDYERAEKAYQEAIDVASKIGNKLQEVISFSNLSYIAYHQGDFERAEAIAREAISRRMELGNISSIPQELSTLAGPLAAQGNVEKAARLLGASDALLEAMGLFIQPGDRFEAERYESAIRAQLDDATFEAAWAEGQAMSLEQAIAFALEE
jgi:predicted ATPase/DNA-binding CsgD family transcriptional regulator